MTAFFSTSFGASGMTGVATFTPVAGAYTAGALVDTAKLVSFTYSTGLPIPPGSLIRVLTVIIKNDVASVPANQSSFTGQAYSVTPPSAQADKATWTMFSADLTVYRGPVPLGTPASIGSSLYVKTQYVNSDIRLGAGLSSMFLELVTVGNPTLAATAILVELEGIVL